VNHEAQLGPIHKASGNRYRPLTSDAAIVPVQMAAVSTAQADGIRPASGLRFPRARGGTGSGVQGLLNQTTAALGKPGEPTTAWNTWGWSIAHSVEEEDRDQEDSTTPLKMRAIFGPAFSAFSMTVSRGAPR